MSKSFSSIDPKKQALRDDLNSHTEVFFATGGKLQQIPPGVCASIPLDMAGYNEQTFRNRQEAMDRSGSNG